MKGLSVALNLRSGLRWGRTGQGFGELAHPAFCQQAPRQLDQILGVDLTHPFTLALLRQSLLTAFGQIAVVTGGVASYQITHLSRLRLPERFDRCRCVEPGEEHITHAIFPLFNGELFGTKVTGTLAIDRDDFIGQQTQIVLSIGITDTETQTALVLGTNVRHAETGTPNVGAGVRGRTQCMSRQAQSE